MRLSLNLTFELKRTSSQSTTKSDGTLRPGAYENLPSYDTTNTSDGSQPKANSSSGPREHATESHPVSKMTEKLSHTRSLGKKISRMFNKLSGTQHSHRSDTSEHEGSVPRDWVPSIHFELPGEGVSEMSGYQYPSELPGYGVTEELSGLSSYNTYQQQPVPRSLQAHEETALAVHGKESCQHHDHLYGPKHTKANTNTNQQYFAPQVLPHSPNTTQTVPTSAWPPSPRDVSPLKGHSSYPYQPSVAEATPLSHVPSAATSDSVSSTTFAPACPPPYNNEENEVDEYPIWHENAQPLPTYPISPPYGNHQHEDEVYSSISPVSSHHGHVGGYHGSFMYPPTPPMASPSNLSIPFSPTEPLQSSFEGVQSSPSSEVFSQQGLSAVAASRSTELVTSNSTSHNVMPTSHWERRPRMVRTHGAPLASVDETLSSYNEPPTRPSVVNSDTTLSFDVVSPQITSGNRGNRSSIAKGHRKLPPLLCGHCEIEFNGQYQKGNMQRHVRRFHSMTVVRDGSLYCRSCPAVYKRADARRKHEWKKHKTEDCRPEKRRVEKRKVVEKRIYMPNMHEYAQAVIG